MEKKPTRQRIVEVMLKVLARPNHFSRKALAEHFDCDVSQIKKDFNHIMNAGITVEQEKRAPYRYTIIPDSGFRELEYLQQLSQKDQDKIKVALQKFYSNKDAMYISNKLASLYNFQRLGIRALRRPSLDRINTLEEANRLEKRVVLKSYRSNSGAMKDRLVEPFDIDVSLDTLQAFEIEKGKVVHFRLPRIERVEMTDQDWEYKTLHKGEKTDVFRIANNNQVYVHLKLKAQAYNYLVENYHKAQNDIHPASEEGTWDFEASVNKNFYGLTNFILAHYQHIQVVEPQLLKDHVVTKANEILKLMQDDF